MSCNNCKRLTAKEDEPSTFGYCAQCYQPFRLKKPEPVEVRKPEKVKKALHVPLTKV